MPVLALVANKGGVGKTTLCLSLASTLSADASTVVLDADPQRSSLQWRGLSDRDEQALSVIDAADDAATAIGLARAEYDYVIVDCPAAVHGGQTARVLASCDLALIPVQPSPLDIWATVQIEGKVAEARQVNPGLRAMLVINQLEPRTRLSRTIRQALAELGLPAARTAIRRRVAYRSAVLEGCSVKDLGTRGSAAAAEIRRLLEEVLRP